MRYTPAQIDRLAPEYVLGTMHGHARRRFDRLIADRADVRASVWRWERDLNDLAHGLETRMPPRHVWEKIRRRIDGSRPTETRLFQRWRGLWVALPAAVAAAWLVLALFPVTVFERVAVFAGQDAQVLWVISADLDTGILRTETVNGPDLETGRDYELWLLPADGRPPLSLGLLTNNPGSLESQIPSSLIATLSDAQTLAISVEPEGGSPTGQPTGPVVYQATIVTI